jgi:sarcosine oxidase delta subunit
VFQSTDITAPLLLLIPRCVFCGKRERERERGEGDARARARALFDLSRQGFAKYE